MVVITAVYTLIPAPYCQNVIPDVTLAKLNGSAAEFKSFRERFQRMYEVNSQQFERRLVFFQVGFKRGGAFSCFLLNLSSGEDVTTNNSHLCYEENVAFS